jgi:hypothetical protein
MADAKNKLVEMGGNLESPNMAKAEDFPVKTPKQGMAEGMNKLVKAPESPRHIEDDGPGEGYGTPVPNDVGSKIGSVWKVGQSMSEGGTKVKCDWGVDLESGDATPNVEDDRLD